MPDLERREAGKDLRARAESPVGLLAYSVLAASGAYAALAVAALADGLGVRDRGASDALVAVLVFTALLLAPAATYVAVIGSTLPRFWNGTP